MKPLIIFLLFTNLVFADSAFIADDQNLFGQTIESKIQARERRNQGNRLRREDNDPIFMNNYLRFNPRSENPTIIYGHERSMYDLTPLLPSKPRKPRMQIFQYPNMPTE